MTLSAPVNMDFIMNLFTRDKRTKRANDFPTGSSPENV
jgi:hypothetical protein